MFFVTFLLHFSNHFLEGAAASDGLKNLRGDAIGNALDSLLEKCLALYARIKYFVIKKVFPIYLIIKLSFIVIPSIISLLLPRC